MRIKMTAYKDNTGQFTRAIRLVYRDNKGWFTEDK